MRLPRPTFLKHIFLAAVALIAGVSTLEVGLNVREILQPPGESLDSASPASYRESRVLERSWTAHHRLKPLQAFSVVGPDDAPVPIATNSLGLRGREFEVPKPSDVFRILCLGDEAVLAAETLERDTFCARLQDLLQIETQRTVEVVNAGVPGYCPLLSYLQTRHDLLALGADLVVLHFDMGDVADDHRVRGRTATKNGVPVACPHHELVQSSARRGLAPWERFLLVREGRRRLEEYTGDGATPEDRRDIDAPEGRYAWLRDDPPDWSVYVEQTLSPIETLARLVESSGGRLVVVTSPAPWQVAKSATNAPGVRRAAGVPEDAVYESSRPFETIAAWCAERAVPFLDTSETFRQHERPERLFLDQAPRFSALGHEVFARELSRWIAPAVAASRAPSAAPRYLEPPGPAAKIPRMLR